MMPCLATLSRSLTLLRKYQLIYAADNACITFTEDSYAHAVFQLSFSQSIIFYCVQLFLSFYGARKGKL